MMVASDVFILSSSSLSMLALNVRVGRPSGATAYDVSIQQVRPQYLDDPITTTHAARHMRFNHTRFLDGFPACTDVFPDEARGRAPVCADRYAVR